MRYSRIVHLAKREADNKKGNPISEISFFDSDSFARTHKLEFVVQGNSPGVFFVIYAFSVSSECVFSVQLYVLLKGYVTNSIPVGQVISKFVSADNIGLQTGQAAEIHFFVNIVVSYCEIPGANFLPVSFAIGEACVPSGVVVFSSGVLPVFTEYVELLNRYVQANAVNFIVFVGFFSSEVVSIEFSKAKVISPLSKIQVFVSQTKFIAIQLAKAGSESQFAIVVGSLCTIIAFVRVDEPAALVAKYDR